MKEHPNSEVLQWLAAGEQVQVSIILVNEWKDFPMACSDQYCGMLLKGGAHNLQFRIKPKMVKIGEREVEAPLKSISQGEKVWYRSFDGGMYHCRFDEASMMDTQMFADGRFFDTKEAALAAHEAITALLTGK